MQMSVGNHRVSNGSYEHIVGNHNRSYGNHNHITGNHNHSEGDSNHITGNHNHVRGQRNHVTGNHNHIWGNGNTVSGRNNYVNDVLQKNDEADDDDDVDTVNFGGSGGGFQIQYKNGTVVNTFGIVNNSKKKKSKIAAADPLFTECPLSTDEDVIVPDDAPEDTPTCVVCTTNKPICVIIPCMHKNICCSCARILCADGTKERGQVKCPMCQAEVHKIGKVFE